MQENNSLTQSLVPRSMYSSTTSPYVRVHIFVCIVKLNFTELHLSSERESIDREMLMIRYQVVGCVWECSCCGFLCIINQGDKKEQKKKCND